MKSENPIPRRGRNWPLILTAGALSTVMLYFGTGLSPIPALTWLAPIPVLLLATRVSGATAATVAFTAGFIAGTNQWGWYLVSFDAPMWPMGLVITLAYALTLTAVVWIFHRLLQKRLALLGALASPAIWVGVLYLVEVSNPKGITGTLATTQADLPVLLQSTTIIGTWGLEYLVLLVPCAVAAALAPGVRSAARIRTAATAAAVLALVVAGGAWRLLDRDTTVPTQQVALLSHDKSGWGAELAEPGGRDLLDSYVEQIRALPETVSTVVLPEGEFAADAADRKLLDDPIRSLTKELDVSIVVGHLERIDGRKDILALAFPAGGGEPVSYLKISENRNPAAAGLVFQPGTGKQTGLEICLDVNFADPTRDYAAAGARFLVIPAADEIVNGWQHSRTAVLRAAENGMSMVWAGRTGTLTASDGYGHVLADKNTGLSDGFSTVIVDVPPGPGATVFTRLGDWAAWLCLALAVVAVAVSIRRSRSMSTQDNDQRPSAAEPVVSATEPIGT